jgi:branched-chain amino acid transport system permease protein
MEFSWDLVINAIVTGIVLGGFYASVAIGVTIAFVMLDIVNIAHPAFMIAGSYLAFLGWESFGFDPFVSMAVFAPCGYLFGRAFYRAYHFFFERRGGEAYSQGWRVRVRCAWGCGRAQNGSGNASSSSLQSSNY